MTLDDLINSTVVCGDHVKVISLDDDGNETVYFDDFTDELDFHDFEDDEILSHDVTFIEAQNIRNKTTLLITVAND